MQSKKFQRAKENLTCEKCRFFVKGNGYTNHCPKCLWSKHVDINPGDRKSKCKGLMKPYGIEINKGVYIILHRCVLCGMEKKNKISKDDDFDIIVKLSNN